MQLSSPKMMKIGGKLYLRHKKVDDHIFQYNQLLDNVPGLAADPIYNVAEIGENNVEQYVIDNQDKLFGKFRTYDYLGMHYTKIGKQP